MKTIFFPTQLGRDTLHDFFLDLELSKNEPEICVDCSTLNFSYPSGMLVAGSKIRAWIKHRRDAGLVTKKKGHDSTKNVHGYLRHLGFFQFIGMGEGNDVGQASGSMTYLPITRIEKPAFNAATQDIQDWYDEIISQTRRFANLLSGTLDYNEENKLYHYALREIIRNVFEHSTVDECYLCGQRWADGRVEVAVVDEGVGISTSLKRSFHIESEIAALRMAIKPGISSTTHIVETDNTYGNSGFGLYVLEQLASSFGWFMIGSGTAKLVSQSNIINEQKLNFDGTYIGLRLNRAPNQFSGLLDDIIYTGEQEAEIYGIRAKASGMSKLT
ncbi:sensor histidine kinase [Vibrio cholerae]|uniref:ATP-binding protein n=2 Tax=Vibrio cholerae TaxID=666 RepID=UPI002271567F|nr:ATP-binding protein [Vibrio cholerae]MCX9490874.1 sensor histidine kinase [Vibrio cholerae]MCX9522295.1 sensor histidine kinase [Vibrio cholerae]